MAEFIGWVYFLTREVRNAIPGGRRDGVYRLHRWSAPWCVKERVLVHDWTPQEIALERPLVKSDIESKGAEPPYHGLPNDTPRIEEELGFRIRWNSQL
jgi:hypothetical protein